MHVRAKKRLGQHFLTDHNIARKIACSLRMKGTVIEVGPGTGMLTRYLLERQDLDLYLVEVDRESVDYLISMEPRLRKRIIHADILEFNPAILPPGELGIIGNFPYNISSQIFFKILEHRQRICEVVCMVQREVAERISARAGSRTYGILSVLLQAFFNIEYLFSVSEKVFYPMPRVKSAVIRLERKAEQRLSCDEEWFFRLVKTAFNQRRKTLRNSLKGIITAGCLQDPVFSLRPEQLDVDQFVRLATLLSPGSPGV